MFSINERLTPKLTVPARRLRRDHSIPLATLLSLDEPLKLLAIGSRESVVEAIRTFHSLRYAEVNAWSPLLPAPIADEVMTILTRKRGQFRLTD